MNKIKIKKNKSKTVKKGTLEYTVYCQNTQYGITHKNCPYTDNEVSLLHCIKDSDCEFAKLIVTKATKENRK